MTVHYEGCSCHINPPCDFCMSLTEEEADIMWNGGREALEEYRRKKKKRKLNPKSLNRTWDSALG